MKLVNLSHPTGPVDVDMCNDFFSRFRGLMFKSKIDAGQGICLITNPPGRINSSIHMFFMRFDIAVLWLDESMNIVDKTLALKWHPYYAPSKPAAMTIEMHPQRLIDFNIGDKVEIINA